MSLSLASAQLHSPHPLPAAVLEATWRMGQVRGDAALCARVLERKECPRGVLEAAALSREAAVRVALVSAPATTLARARELLASERRAGVLASLSARGVHAEAVRERVQGAFTQRATAALAPIIVQDASFPDELRVQAAILVRNRLGGELREAGRELVRTCSAETLQPLLCAVEQEELLLAGLVRGVAEEAAQLHAFEVLVAAPCAAARSLRPAWMQSHHEQRILRHLGEWGRAANISPAVRERAAVEAKRALTPKVGELLLALSGAAVVPAARSVSGYKRRVASAVKHDDWDEAEVLLRDVRCPSELLAPLASILVEMVPEDEELRAAFTERSGCRVLVEALLAADAGAYLGGLGWLGVRDEERARVISGLTHDDLTALAYSEGLGEIFLPGEVGMLSWSAVSQSMTGWAAERFVVIAAEIARLQEEVLGSSAEAWEVYTTLSETHTGSVDELLQASVDVVG